MSTLGRGLGTTLKDGLTRLPTPQGERFVNLFIHGKLQVEVRALRGTYPKRPRDHDEVYVDVHSTGVLLCDGHRA